MLEEQFEEQTLPTHYTPELNDFYFGFEFEYKDSGYEDFIKCMFIGDYRHLEQCTLEYTRVKYLDTKDLEEVLNPFKTLGTPIDERELGFTNITTGDSYNLYYNEVGNHLVINKLVKNYDGGVNERCVFEGVIRNKSELKKLLGFLNIKTR